MVKKSSLRKTPERKGNLLHHSKLTIEYFVSVDDVTVNDTPRKVVKYTLVSAEIPKGSVKFSAVLPNLSGEALDMILFVETEWTRVLCTGLPVVAHAVNLLRYGCESTASKTAMLDRVSQDGNPVKLRQSRNRENKRLADKAGEELRREVALILEVPDGRKSDYLFPSLPILHERLKPLWKGAHEIAKSAQRSRCEFSDAEVVTTAIVAMLFFGGNFERARSFLHSSGMMPRMLSRSRLSRRLSRLSGLIDVVFHQLGLTLKELNLESRYSLDSFPVAMCDFH